MHDPTPEVARKPTGGVVTSFQNSVALKLGTIQAQNGRKKIGRTLIFSNRMCHKTVAAGFKSGRCHEARQCGPQYEARACVVTFRLPASPSSSFSSSLPWFASFSSDDPTAGLSSRLAGAVSVLGPSPPYRLEPCHGMCAGAMKKCK